MASPAWALVKRDGVALLRQRRSYYLLVAMVGTCIISVSAMWPWEDVPLFAVGGQSRQMFAFFSTVLLLAATVLPPGLAALAFVEERRQDTLDQLRLSLISPRALVLSKLVTATGLLLLMLVATFPALGVQLFLVGVSGAEVVALAAVVLSTALAAAAAGLLSGILFRRPVVSLVGGYAITAFVFGGWALIVILIGGLFFLLTDYDPEMLLNRWVPGGSLVMDALELALEAALDAYDRGLNSQGIGTALAVKSVTYRLLGAALCTVVASRILRRPPKPLRIPRERPIDDPQALRMRRRRFPFYLIDPLRRRPPIPDNANPLLVRELRHGLGMRARTAIRIFAAAAVVYTTISLFATWAANSDPEAIRIGLLWETGILVFLVPVLTAGVMAREREQDLVDFLWSSLLAPREILRGKLGAAMASVAPVLLGVVAAAAVATPIVAAMKPDSLSILAAGYVTLFVCAWFSLCLALCVSVHARSTASALTAALLLSAAAYLGPLVGGAMLDLLWHPNLPLYASIDQPIMAFSAYLSPMTAYATADFTRQEFRLGYYPNWISPATQVGLFWLSVLTHAAAGYGLLALALRRLRERVAGAA